MPSSLNQRIRQYRLITICMVLSIHLPLLYKLAGTLKKAQYMPSLTPITINDGAADHEFKPRGTDSNGVTTLNESSGVPIADRRITVARTRTSAGREKTTLRLVLPVVQTPTVNGVEVPTLARQAYADVTFSFDPTSTAAERQKARLLASDLLVDPSIESVIDDLETLY